MFFQTVFSSGEYDMLVDAMHNQLFESNQNLCSEDEFEVEGELIFLPLLRIRFGSLKQSTGIKDKRCKTNAIIMKNTNAFEFIITQLLYTNFFPDLVAI